MRQRREGRLDAGRLAWGGAVAIQIAAFWRQVLEVAAVATTWPASTLALLLLYVALLVVAAACALPLRTSASAASPTAGRSLSGRVSIAALAAFNAVTLVADSEVWREGLLTEPARISLALLVVSGAGLFGVRSRVTLAAAFGYIVLVGWQLVEAWRAGY